MGVTGTKAERKAFHEMCEELDYRPGQLLAVLGKAASVLALEWLEHADRGIRHEDFPHLPPRALRLQAIKELAGAIDIEKTMVAYEYAKPRTVELTGKDGGPVQAEHVWRVEVVDAEPSDPGKA